MARKKAKISGSAKGARRKARKKKGLIGVRKKKEFSYRGFSLEELQKMPADEFVELLPARARRSLTRKSSEERDKFMMKLQAGKKDVIRTHRRDVVVLPNFVGKTIAVYNGREFKEVNIAPEMIGHFLGEFALTRVAGKHSGPGVGATRSSKFMPLK